MIIEWWRAASKSALAERTEGGFTFNMPSVMLEVCWCFCGTAMSDEALRPMADRPPTARELERWGDATLDRVSLLDATLTLGGGGDLARGISAVVGVGGEASSSV
jgi:hypothetical protein